MLYLNWILIYCSRFLLSPTFFKISWGTSSRALPSPLFFSLAMKLNLYIGPNSVCTCGSDPLVGMNRASKVSRQKCLVHQSFNESLGSHSGPSHNISVYICMMYYKLILPSVCTQRKKTKLDKGWIAVWVLCFISFAGQWFIFEESCLHSLTGHYWFLFVFMVFRCDPVTPICSPGMRGSQKNLITVWLGPLTSWNIYVWLNSST